jgi:hypothetical protein
MGLTKSQSKALEFIRDYARTRKENARVTLAHILKMSNIPSQNFDLAVSNIKKHARVCLHFHPDRLDPENLSVASALFQQGIYKSQFETMLSSGSVSAVPGGERDLWEKQIYGSAYHVEDSAISERPRYGALDLMRHAFGPAPRFGSCYFILKPHVTKNCTFTYLDSHHNPDEKGTLDEFDDILAALFTEAFTRDFALGEENLSVPRLIDLLNGLGDIYKAPSHFPIKRNFDHYIEAQIHSIISLSDDVEFLVADPSFKGTDVGQTLEEICKKFGIVLFWHEGFGLKLNEVPTNFRGPTLPSLAKRVATKEYLDAAMIGEAAKSLRNNPELWSDRGSYKEVLQELKLLWHVLLKFGKPLSNFKNESI